MAIYKNSRYTNAYVFADMYDRNIIYLNPINEPRFSPSPDDLLIEMNQGDRLDLIAERFYGDPVLDWVILEANPNLRSAFDISTGDIIRIPLPENVRDILA